MEVEVQKIWKYQKFFIQIIMCPINIFIYDIQIFIIIKNIISRCMIKRFKIIYNKMTNVSFYYIISFY